MRRLHYETIGSTNSQARALAEVHPGERLLVTAARQSAGRGRHGRVWQSPLGGAWMSIAWPMLNEPRAYAPVSLVTAVAVRRALRELGGGESPDLRIKWPNDLLIADCKVAGILCELSPSVREARGGILIVGIGVNVNFDPALLAGDLRHPATTLSAAWGRFVDVEAVITAVRQQVLEALASFECDALGAELLDELRASLAYIGTVRTWSSPRGEITGRVLGVDDAGRLLLESNGQITACDVGEFTPAR
jgi:BirA family biotin operon repressor/biotin-[acetyl-CoA-carboxylase] ligase